MFNRTLYPLISSISFKLFTESQKALKLCAKHDDDADLKRSAIRVDHGAEAFAFAGVKCTDVLATVGPRIDSTTVSAISVEPTVIHL